MTRFNFAGVPHIDSLTPNPHVEGPVRVTWFFPSSHFISILVIFTAEARPILLAQYFDVA